MPLEARFRLLDDNKCTMLILAGNEGSIFSEVVRCRPEIRTAAPPDFEALLTIPDITPYTYSHTFEDVRDDPILVLHTSGTTGQYSDSNARIPQLRYSRQPEVDRVHECCVELSRWTSRRGERGTRHPRLDSYRQSGEHALPGDDAHVLDRRLLRCASLYVVLRMYLYDTAK